MGIDALYFAARRNHCIVGASSSAVSDVLALLAFTVHIILELVHVLPGLRLGQVFHARMVPDIAHDILGHSYKAIAWIDAPIRSHSKGVVHAVHKGADCAPAGKDAPAVVIDVSDFNPADVLQILVKKIDQ